MTSESFATIAHIEHDTGLRRDLPHAGDWEAAAAAAAIDLLQKISQGGDLSAACRLMANELQQFLGCEQVAVGLRRRGRGPCRLAAVSGMADLDPRSNLPRRLEAAMDEAVLEADRSHDPKAGEEDACDSARQRSKPSQPGGKCSIPLCTGDGTIVGVWTLLGSPGAIGSPATRRFLALTASSVAGTLQLLVRAEGGPLRRAVRRITRAMPKVHRRVLALAAALAAAALCMPVPYDIGVQCELQPESRRFVAAPYAGEFQKSLVKPGDLVAQGQVLARMEGRELRWELAGVVAEEEHARKSRDVNMAAGKTAAAQIDELEIRRQEVKRQLLERRLANLEIKSPVNGIVVTGDLQRCEGVPVTVGQVLYEVAPLSRMTAELAIADEEVSRVTAGMPATLRLDSQPGRQWSAGVVNGSELFTANSSDPFFTPNSSDPFFTSGTSAGQFPAQVPGLSAGSDSTLLDVHTSLPAASSVESAATLLNTQLQPLDPQVVDQIDLSTVVERQLRQVAASLA